MGPGGKQYVIPFAIELLFGGWGTPYTIVSAVISLLPLAFSDAFAPDAAGSKKVEIIGLVFAIWIFLKILRQYWLSFVEVDRRIGIITGLTAEHASAQDFVVKLPVFASAHNNQLLTLYSNKSDVPQVIGLLRVIDTTNAGAVIAVPVGDVKIIQPYFKEASDRKALFVRTSVTSTDVVELVTSSSGIEE